VYDEGCPCFDTNDVETFLNFASVAGGNCGYDDGGSTYVSLSASLNAAYYSIYATTTQCLSFRANGMLVSIDDVEFGACTDIIVNTGVKDEMEAAGCYISYNQNV
jgi:hypothetical protein